MSETRPCVERGWSSTCLALRACRSSAAAGTRPWWARSAAPLVHSIVSNTTRARQCGLLRGLLHAGRLVSGPTGRLAWQRQKRRRAHVGQGTPLGAKQNQLGLDECSRRMQPCDLRMQPVSSLRKLGAHSTARAGRLRSGLRGDGEGEDGDRDEKDAKHCTNRKPGRKCAVRPSSEPAPRAIHGAHRQRRAEKKELASARPTQEKDREKMPYALRHCFGEVDEARLYSCGCRRRNFSEIAELEEPPPPTAQGNARISASARTCLQGNARISASARTCLRVSKNKSTSP